MTRDKAVLRFLSEVGKLGGHARARALSPIRRKEIGRKAIAARWANYRRKLKEAEKAKEAAKE